jgi:hypothetical protein
MKVKANEIYHLHNTGNNNYEIFRERDNYRLFLNMFYEHVKPYCEIICWGLVPDEYNFIIKVKEQGLEKVQIGSTELSRFSNALRRVHSQYARVMNVNFRQSGSFFNSRCKADPLKDEMIGVLINKLESMPINSGEGLYSNQLYKVKKVI